MENKPIADRTKNEVDAFIRLWREKRWLAILLTVILIGFVVLSILGWLQRGSTISDLKFENRELKRDIRQIEAENKSLRETVAPLILQATKEFPGEEISESLKKIIAKLELEDPLYKPIASATATVEVNIESSDQINIRLMERGGGYLAFCRETDALLVTSSKDSYARQTGNNVVIYSAVFQMPATNSAVGKPIEFLKDSDYLQIKFLELPNNSKVLEGRAVVVINGSMRFEFLIPPQKMQEDIIFVKGIKGFIEKQVEKTQ